MTLEEIRVLSDLGLNVDGYHRLVMYLKINNPAEADRILKTPRIVFEVQAMVEILNAQRRLPEKFKHLVKEYQGFQGVDLESEKFSF